ncbi:MAG TPA: PepSY domain-containing protein [Gemmatimonadaceae bacterium]
MITKSIIVAAIVALAGSSVHAQTTYKRDIPDSLAKQAKITEAAAAATAKKRVPKGTIDGVELEREKGKLMFSYDMKTPGKSGIDEVNVDAITGKIIGFSHESPSTEKKEAAAETKAKQATRVAPKKP